MPRERQTAGNQPDRPNRVPLHEQKNKISIADQDPSYHYRWVSSNLNTDPDRVERFKRAGWELASGSHTVGDSRVEDLTNRTSSVIERYMGQGLKCVLMRIRKDWYEEDQRAKQDEIDIAERAMHQDAKKDRYGSFRKKSSTDYDDAP